MTGHADWLSAWQIATTMCQWSPDRTAAYADHTWRSQPDWTSQLTADDLDAALHTLETTLANSPSRPAPGQFTAALRAQAARHHRPRFDTTPPTADDRAAARTGMALCRWSLDQTRQGHPPTLTQVRAKAADPNLLDQWGRPDDATTTPAQLLATQN